LDHLVRGIICVPLALFLLLPAICFADTETKSSLWTMSLNRFQFTEKYRGFLDIQPRFTVDDVPKGDDGSINTVLIRGALGYQFKPNIGIYQGYAIRHNFPIYFHPIKNPAVAGFDIFLNPV